MAGTKGHSGVYKRTLKHRTAISDSHKGIKMPKEHRLKVRKNTKKLWKTKQYRELISDKVSKGVKKRWQTKKYRDAQKKVKFHKHHIYLKENSDDRILIPKEIHQKLHLFAYHYLVKIKKIDAYLRWFKNKVGGF